MVSLTCPRCMEQQLIKLDLDDGETLTCGGCDETFTVSDVSDLVAGWSRILPWLAQHPANVDAGEVTAR